jgi:hypothetical protein
VAGIAHPGPERDTTLNALAIEALNDLLKKRGKEPVVENPLADDE